MKPSAGPSGSSSKQHPQQPPPIVTVHSRRYINQSSIPYPLPCDVREFSRQSLVHELFLALQGSPTLSEITPEELPSINRILDVGCGTGLWCASMSEHLSSLGRPNVHFTGLDLVPVHTDMSGLSFTFVQHNLVGGTPLPFPDGYFDMVYTRDMTFAFPSSDMYHSVVSELTRILRPGGIFEVHCVDSQIRCISRTSQRYKPGSSTYAIGQTTQFQNSDNPYIIAYNQRLMQVLNKRHLAAFPCALIPSALVSVEKLVSIKSRREALPFDEIWWESTTPAASSSNPNNPPPILPPSLETSRVRNRNRRSSTSAASAVSAFPSPLAEQEKAVRYLARLVFVQLVESLEGVIRQENRIEEDDWERWYRGVLWNLMDGMGGRGGECWEYGAWWGRRATS